MCRRAQRCGAGRLRKAEYSRLGPAEPRAHAVRGLCSYKHSHSAHAPDSALLQQRSSPCPRCTQAGRRADTCCPHAPSRGGYHRQTCVFRIRRALASIRNTAALCNQRVPPHANPRGEHAASTCASHIGRHAGRLEERLQLARLVHADRIWRSSHPSVVRRYTVGMCARSCRLES